MSMQACPICSMNLEQPDFSQERIVRIPRHVAVENFSKTVEIYEGARCTECSRQWNNHGDLIEAEPSLAAKSPQE
jgi:hypothetical protein